MLRSSAELQTSIFKALTTDAGIVAKLGGPKVYDDAPEHASFPYLTLGRTTVVDWSTGSEDGAEHVLTLHVWGRGGGKAETFAIMDEVTNRLHDAHLPLGSHRLVNLQLQFAEARREPDSPNFHGILRFRAVTEPLA
ncbi:DUF3168 domain-containing protein [Aureimonas leprariae]|uniref:DUF3168 domain-containing protein n=1 Tax=Plantimonas leprariae TaxID=2615207 RepID=A0A7V7TWG4_9HYPH|nr:DUF3168 domain-containing protein [Aureimonas leprariae]KAB0679948.1 DUF3168 domain-containing protein [Aureimonas leprariae]